MDKKKVFLRLVFVLFLVLVFISTVLKKSPYGDTYYEAISKVVESDHLKVFQIEDMVVDKQINENQFFVLYKNYDNKLCAGVFDRNKYGLKRNSLSIGIDSYDLDKDLDKTIDIEASCSSYKGGTFYYGKIVNNLVDKVFVGDNEAEVIVNNDLKYFYYINTNDYEDHMEFSCTFHK